MLSILTYSVCSFASGLSRGVISLAVFRFILGLGMGGEWNTGATLVAETWPRQPPAPRPYHWCRVRGQSASPLAALVAGVVLRYTKLARRVFFVGILPAALTLWIQSRVPESEIWERKRQRARSETPLAPPPLDRENDRQFVPTDLPPAPIGRARSLCCFLNFFRNVRLVGTLHLAPTLPVSPRRARADAASGRWVQLPCSSFLTCSVCSPDTPASAGSRTTSGRRRSFYPVHICRRPASSPCTQWRALLPLLLALGTIVAFFGTGFFFRLGHRRQRKFFPTRVRAARALGFTYNGARTMSSLAPLTIGWVGQIKGLSWAFYLLRGGHSCSPASWPRSCRRPRAGVCHDFSLRCTLPR